ncbi:MAG: DNA repair protein RecO [Chlamydiae bacterium]|nr:DNA repair protein RecO [Chlamydiota bacterium]MBI3277364.1 DNA repair protein RecO [Chlamydiota bacterium]
MLLIRTQAILLHKRDFSDTSLIAVFFTKNSGKLHFIIKGAKQPKTSFMGSFEHGSCYEILYRHSSRKQGLITLRQAHLVEAFSRIRADLHAFYHAVYCLELLDAFTELEDSDESLFNLIFTTLRQMDESLKNPLPNIEWMIRSFEVKLLSHLGFLGNLSSCFSCRESFRDLLFLDHRTARLLCEKCTQTKTYPFHVQSIQLIPLLMRAEPCTPVDKGAEEKKELKNLLWFYIDFHLGKPLKSRKFLIEKI